MSDCRDPITVTLSFFNPELLTGACAFLQDAVEPTPFDPISYLKYFLITCAFESPFYLWLTRRDRLRQRLGILALCNLATHPAIFFLFPRVLSLFQISQRNYVASAELFAPAVEALLLWKVWKYPARHSFAIAFLANVFSWAVGLLLSI